MMVAASGGQPSFLPCHLPCLRLAPSHPEVTQIRRKLASLVAAALVTLAILPASSEGDAIGRANLNGTGANQNFITGIGFPIGVAVDPGHVYWADLHTDAIGRANLDGS